MAREPLSNVDTAWLRMEDPTNLMMVTGVMIFSAPMDFERLKATIKACLLRFDRFRQRVVSPRLPLGPYYWEDDPGFDLNVHLQRVTLPPPGDQVALEETVSYLMSTPLDFSRPLWQVHLVERYGDGCALIARLHHCIADGIALVHVLLSLTDRDPAAPWPVARPAERPRRDRGPLEALLRPARSAFRTTARFTETLLQEGLETLTNPSHALDRARLGASGATALGKLALRWPDPKTLFKGPLGVDKQAAWSAPIPLPDVKAVGRVMGGTVNDVLLAAVTGALRRYMQDHGEPVEGLNLRAVVPVNLRPLDKVPEPGNNFGLVFLSLPVDIADPVERLFELKRRMDDLKDSPEAVVVFGLLNAVGMAPSEIQDIVVNIFGTKATAVMTNVPGPRETIYLAGAPLDTIMFWVPQSGHLGMGVSIISYAGQVRLGIVTDKGLVPDPEDIIAGFRVEFDELAELARQVEADQAVSAPALKPIPEGSVAALTAKLDDALQKVTAMLESTQAPQEKTPDRCQALTKTGRPCKNRPLPGSNFCHVHQKQEAAVTQ
jgi:diacylglycerol O-acyltransferase